MVGRRPGAAAVWDRPEGSTDGRGACAAGGHRAAGGLQTAAGGGRATGDHSATAGDGHRPAAAAGGCRATGDHSATAVDGRRPAAAGVAVAAPADVQLTASRRRVSLSGQRAGEEADCRRMPGTSGSHRIAGGCR